MRKTLIALSLAATALTGAANAQRPDMDGAGIITRTEAAQRADARFASMDADHDGTVTPDERRAERDRRRSQRDGDGGTRHPRPDMAGPGGPAGAGMRRPEPKPESAAEFRARALERFDRMDTNHDGRVDQAERAAARDRMGPPPGGQTPPPPPAN